MNGKEPGQVAYEAFYGVRDGSSTSYRVIHPSVARSWANAETAVRADERAKIAAAKSERVAGVWIDGPEFLATAPCNFQLISGVGGSWRLVFGSEDMMPLTEDDARKVVEALGGTWPEEADNAR
jgi:hypothetical protein